MTTGARSFYQSDLYAQQLRTLSYSELSAEFRSTTRRDSSVDRTRQLWAINVEMYVRARDQMSRDGRLQRVEGS